MGEGDTGMRKVCAFFIGLILLAEVAGVAALSQTVNEVWAPGGMDKAEMLIRDGDSYRMVIERLAEASNLDSPEVVATYGIASGLDRKVKKGRYRIDDNWSPAQALEQTALGPNDPLRVKILPGLTLRDCARTMHQAGWIESATSWINLASPSTSISPLGTMNYEGLLAPETYFFDSPEDPAVVLDRLHTHWRSFISRVAGTDDLKARLRNGLTLYDTIIVASIVEKEAAKPPEMATAASVFHNRLRKKWPLGSAATLRYLMGPWKGRDDQLPVNSKSPFNTSKRPGLPPTPICIPSEAALLAAISPPETSFLFFNGNGDGSLVFNKSHAGHKSSVANYRKKIAEREKQQKIGPGAVFPATATMPIKAPASPTAQGTAPVTSTQ